jgi:hypothetical protein
MKRGIYGFLARRRLVQWLAGVVLRYLYRKNPSLETQMRYRLAQRDKQVAELIASLEQGLAGMTARGAPETEKAREELRKIIEQLHVARNNQ